VDLLGSSNMTSKCEARACLPIRRRGSADILSRLKITSFRRFAHRLEVSKPLPLALVQFSTYRRSTMADSNHSMQVRLASGINVLLGALLGGLPLAAQLCFAGD
jgi:hypothetical protein